ncbi:Type I secretion outer membrane protein, TolC family [Paraburkholderia ribeironis]|uniref:Type I secretion outer membrane protein, TolC family n=1 Tax=Paraburkholderia ribeironis TaxID=1247936 RepID=A0A1N7RYT9_9BURK|nr:TolC family outer membrane protein [Paraburkholderia ribeironis]SIT40229.1 Type I secretion outer membrane protein, TolC family [Paraburkholderia ribeironis]
MARRALLHLLIALACIAHAGAATAVDLLTVVAQAIDHDADLAASRAGARAARQAAPKARAALLPQIAGGWGRAYNSMAIDGFPRNSYWQNGWTVTLTQPVFDWGRWTAYRQADLVGARGVLDEARAQQSVMLQTVRAYFDELAAEDELARADDYTAAMQQHMAQLKLRQAAGEATVIDLQEAAAAYEQGQLQQQDARSDLQLRRLSLEQITGQRFAGLARLSDGALMPRLSPDDRESWAAQAESHDYLVQLKQIDQRIAEFDVQKARARNLPVVNLTASHTPAGAASGYSRPTTTTTAMLSVTIPIFEGGETDAIIDEAHALEDKAQDELLGATRVAGATARENWSRFHDSVARIVALMRLAQTSRAALVATQMGYKVGSRTSTDVLRAADSFYANRRDLIRARYTAIVALLQLKAATATLDLGEIARVNGLLAGTQQRRDVSGDRQALVGNDRTVAGEDVRHTEESAGPPVMSPIEALRLAQQKALAAAR